MSEADTGLTEPLRTLLTRDGFEHLELSETQVDGAGAAVRIAPAPGWRRYTCEGVDEDDNVLQRMAELDELLWPVLTVEDGELVARCDGEVCYRGQDPEALVAALAERLQGPAYSSPVMVMETTVEEDGYSMGLRYEGGRS